MKKITTLLLALLLVIPAMAHNLAANSKMYFAKPDNWANYAQFIIGHNSYSESYMMTKISNTKLYYWNSVQWNGYNQWCIFDQSKWNSEGSSISHRYQYMGNNKTSIGSTALGSYNLINQNGTFTKLTDYKSLNHTQTITIEGEGKTSISTYKMNGANSTTTSTGETSADAAYTATVKCTATADDGSQFIGWYNGSTLLSTNATYSYTAENAAKTITAKFEKLAAETPVINNFVASATNVAAGETVTFTCEVENGDVANVVYTVNGEEIAGNTWTAGPEAGTYTIAATLEGAVSQTLEVTVYVNPSIEAGEYAVFFDNTESQWTTVNAYAWGGNDQNNGWPGVAMTYLGNNIYKYTCEGFIPTQVIFNNKVGESGIQTEDLVWVNGGIYTASSSTPIDVLLPEGIIELVVTPTDVYTGVEVTFNTYFDAEYYEGYELSFEINGVAQNANTWTPEVEGDYRIVAVLTQGENEARSNEVTISVAPSFYVYLMKDGAWETSYIYYWGDAANTWPGTLLENTVTIDGAEYYKFAFRNGATVNIIFNGNGKQTSNIENVTATTYYRITNQEGGEGSYEASATPFVVEQPESLIFTVTVPEGTENCYIVGNFTGSDWATPLVMEAISDVQYTIIIDDLIKSAVKYKYVTNADVNTDDIWKNEEVADVNDGHLDSRSYKEEDVVVKWKGIALLSKENIECESKWYLNTNGLWASDNAWFAAYFFNKNTNQNAWVKGELIAPEYYVFYLSQYNVPEYAAAPARAMAEEAPVYTHVIFCRMNPDFNTLSWDVTEVVDNGDGSTTTNVLEDHVWNQTADLIYDGSQNTTFQITTADGEGNWKVLPTAVESVKVANGIVYANGVVTAEGAIEVYNVGGAVVARGNNNVDLNGLNGGVYIVRNGNNVCKVVR